MKMKIINIVAIIVTGLLLGGCEPPKKERYMILEVIECSESNHICMVKIDKHPWIAHTKGLSVAGDYIEDISPLLRNRGYFVKGHDPHYDHEEKLKEWGESNERF
jgi:hypothetical protein